MTTLHDCQQRDAADPLRHLRNQFTIPDGVIYLEQSGSNAATRRLRIGVQYGRIRWVKESD